MRLIGTASERAAAGRAAATDPTADPAADRDHVRMLKAMVREQLSLTEAVPVVISELRCADEDCAPVETVIAVLATPTRTWKVRTPQAQLSPGDLRILLAGHPFGGHA
jgi:hypothetical protein